MSSLIRGGIIAAILSLIINIVIYLVGTNQGVSWALINAPRPSVSLIMVIIATLVATIGAVALMWLLQRMSSRPTEIFLWIALIFGLLSLIPVYVSTQSRASLIALGLLHVGAALGIVWGLLYGMRDEVIVSE